MTAYHSRRRGRVHVELPIFGARLLADLAGQLVELLRDGESVATVSEDPLERLVAMDGPRDTPDDPALLRLLPDAHRDNPEAAAEFRRFTEQSLRASKVAAAEAVLRGIGELGDLDDESGDTTIELELGPAEARLWMRCLTDLRLTLAARLGVESDDEEHWLSLPEDDARGSLYRIYGWLGYQLESLLEAAR